MRTLLVLALLGLAAIALWVRLAPSDPAEWHVDPAEAPDPERQGVRYIPPEAPVFAAEPEAVMAAFDAIAQAHPRIRVLAGSVAEGHVTYVARSRLWGFPDYLTVKVAPSPEGTVVSLVSRQRFGGSDWGVNRARAEAWLSELEDRLTP